LDTELITAQEFDWIVNNEPTFHAEGNAFIGKVGRTTDGNDIRIKIVMPEEFYPVIKPKVFVLNDIEHPNIDPSGELALQLLEEWETRYRVKDIIVAARRLFLKSKDLIRSKAVSATQPMSTSSAVSTLQDKISSLQNELQSYNQQITKIKADKMHQAGVRNPLGDKAIPISKQQELEAMQKALIDLLGLIEYKFEDASMDEIVFFRLYRKYIREYYLVTKKLTVVQGGKTDVVSKQKEKRAIRN